MENIKKEKKIYIKLKYKFLIFSYIGIIIISLALIGYSYISFREQIIKNEGASGEALSEQINGSANFILKDIFDMSTYIFFDNEVRAFLDKYMDFPSNSILQENVSSKNLPNLVASKNCMTTLSIYNNKGLFLYGVIADNSFEFNSLANNIEKSIMEDAIYANGGEVWFKIDANSHNFFNQNSTGKIALCRAIKDRNLSQISGFILITVNEDVFEKLCINFPIEPGDSIAITNKQDLVLFNSGFTDLSKVKQTMLINSQNSVSGFVITEKSPFIKILAYNIDPKYNFLVYYSFTTPNIFQKTSNLLWYFIIIIVFCISFSIPFMIYVSTKLTKPIRKLLISMHSFKEGNFDEFVETKSNDEFGILANGYNTMVKNISDLVKNNYVLLLKERESELTALLAQINPHFLYNTLDIIYWEAVGKNQVLISEMVLHLSKYFRLSLNKGGSFTTVKNETELIYHYLTLQKMRFGNKINYIIEANPNSDECIVPKLVLQPIVENAFVHGLEKKIGAGNLKVCINIEGKYLTYLISDDGIGMDNEMIMKIMQRPSNNNPLPIVGGYALTNVYDRLQLIYSNDFSFHIESSPGVGTSVSIRFPIRFNENPSEV
jgi:two-component system, sensor histidine kinase YesM